MIADLHEEFAERSAGRPRWRGALWYWREAATLALGYGVACHVRRWLDHGGAAGEEAMSALRVDVTGDLRFSLRSLRRSPGFTAVAVLSLALGIGANTAIFSVFHAMVLRDLPFEAPEELVNVYRDRARGTFDRLSYPDFLEVQRSSRDVFSELGGYQYALAQTEIGDGVQPVWTEMVTGNYLPLLGIRPALGRTLLPEDHVAPGSHPVVMLGYLYWQRAYGADPDVLGRSLVMNGRSFTVVGVAPRSFPGSVRGVSADLFAPIMMVDDILPGGGDPLESRGTNAFMPVGRLRPGVTAAQAQARLSTVAASLKASFPAVWDGRDELRAWPTVEVLFDPSVDRTVVRANILALGVVALVLVIACANLAGFLLAKGVDRRRELALRLALGARRGHLVRQLVTETLLLGVLGGLAGISLALGVLRLAATTELPVPALEGFDLGLNGPVLAFTLGLSLATGILVGLLPALRSTRLGLTSALKDQGIGAAGARALTLGRLLVAGQMASCVVLLTVAGLLIKSFGASRRLDPGFGREPTAVLTFMIPGRTYSEQEGRDLLATVMEETRGLRGVTRVGAISNLHLNPFNAMFLDVNVDGAPPLAGRGSHIVDFTSVTEDFFAAAGIPLLKGRGFTASDGPTGPLVAVINQAMADRFWPRGDALGQTIAVEVPGWSDLSVVGIVADAKIHSLGEPPTPFIYLPHAQAYNAQVSVLAVAGNPERTANELYRMVRDGHPDLIVNASTTLEEHIGVTLLVGRVSALLASVFAAVALGLSVIGLYGVVSYSVMRRRREIGIRMALGATRTGVVALQVSNGMRLVLVGGGVGLILAALAARGLEGLLVEVSPHDPLILGGAAVVLSLSALLAAWLPARKASRIDPNEALRRD